MASPPAMWVASSSQTVELVSFCWVWCSMVASPTNYRDPFSVVFFCELSASSCGSGRSPTVRRHSSVCDQSSPHSESWMLHGSRCWQVRTIAFLKLIFLFFNLLLEEQSQVHPFLQVVCAVSRSTHPILVGCLYSSSFRI